jgi:hypothetical protein
MSRQSPVDHLTLLVAGGSLLTAGAAWTWWRISRTEMSFLRDFHRFAD